MLGSLNLGGTETLMLDLFDQTSQTPFYKLCIYRKDGILSSKFHSSNVPLFKITPGPIWLIWLYLIQIRRLVKHHQISIIHANQSIDTLYARLACVALPIKIVQTTHEFDFQYTIIDKFLKWISIIIADQNLFVSNVLFRYYKTIYKVKQGDLPVIHNAVNFAKFSKTSTISLRKTLNINNEALLMGTVANFGPGHDQATICRFLSLLNKSFTNFCFVFIGAKDENHPHLYDECILFCQNNNLIDKAFFLGARSDVPELLPQFDSFIYSSNYDSFGISVIEAIAIGIPVFVNDWDVMREITENGERAILYTSKDEYDLLNKFMIFKSGPEVFRTKAKENAIWAKSTFSIENHVNKLYSAYNSIM